MRRHISETCTTWLKTYYVHLQSGCIWQVSAGRPASVAFSSGKYLLMTNGDRQTDRQDAEIDRLE